MNASQPQVCLAGHDLFNARDITEHRLGSCVVARESDETAVKGDLPFEFTPAAVTGRDRLAAALAAALDYLMRDSSLVELATSLNRDEGNRLDPGRPKLSHATEREMAISRLKFTLDTLTAYAEDLPF